MHEKPAQVIYELVFHGFAITMGDYMLAKLAQEIVNITSEVIGHDLLITDKDGMVLAVYSKDE